MSFLPGHGAKVFVNEVAVAATVSGCTASHSRALSEVTVVADSGARFVPGLKSGTMALRGPQDTVGQSLHAEIAAAIGTDNTFLATYLPDGDAVGKPAMFALGDPSEWAIDAAVADAVGYTVTAAADESVEMGYVLHALGARTADANGTSVDRTAAYASTTLGAVAAVHVTAYSGFTSVGLKVQHSTDDSTWADLVSFTSITAVGSQLVRVAPGTTVNRYLRVAVDVTGTGSITFMAVAAPR